MTRMRLFVWDFTEISHSLNVLTEASETVSSALVSGVYLSVKSIVFGVVFAGLKNIDGGDDDDDNVFASVVCKCLFSCSLNETDLFCFGTVVVVFVVTADDVDVVVVVDMLP